MVFKKINGIRVLPKARNGIKDRLLFLFRGNVPIDVISIQVLVDKKVGKGVRNEWVDVQLIQTWVCQ